jgi:hypothetical protein
MKKFFITLFIFIFAITTLVLAKPETSAVMSNKCDEAKIRLIVGDALIKIEPQDWGNGVKGFIITLETDKMTFAQLAQKMNENGCY